MAAVYIVFSGNVISSPLVLDIEQAPEPFERGLLTIKISVEDDNEHLTRLISILDQFQPAWRDYTLGWLNQHACCFSHLAQKLALEMSNCYE